MVETAAGGWADAAELSSERDSVFRRMPASLVVSRDFVGGEMGNRDVMPFVLVLMLAACGESPRTQPARPQRAGQPLDPVESAARVASIRANAVLGDQEGVQRDLQALNDEFRRSMKLADPARRIDPESARAAVRDVPGVRSVAWIDHENLLAIVEHNADRSYGTIDRICLRLEPLGDTLGVVVNLQSGAAVDGDQLEILSRNCQLEPGDRAMLQPNRQVDVIAPAIRAQHRANQVRGERRQDQTQQEENARILEASTSEM